MIRFNVLCSVAIAIGLCVQPVVAGCPNGGTGIGFQQFCNINNPIEGPTCDQLYAVIAKDGTCNSNADKAVDNPSSSDLCGGGYTYGASVACQNGVPVTVNPPGEGITGPCREVPWTTINSGIAAVAKSEFFNRKSSLRGCSLVGQTTVDWQRAGLVN
ncbi:hypothetical protein SISSUDRAFT_1037185 [Sistotremastrum suecicum HHB10207 ss-3]|uniref:Uncharacterized protein n=1 Tax=Sistotremastrum suecicum HHB10207 ss-3 TaxID=1314776 RepID=A0A165YH44_9AGAM|nr:hypothetical protein SISSUDRAFT_1037185 [Sistotremastrum suecicum HHB10207 ss-3]